MKVASLQEMLRSAKELLSVRDAINMIYNGLGPDASLNEIIETKEFDCFVGGKFLRAPKSEIQALTALRDKYGAHIIVVDAPHRCFKYDPEDNIPEEPKDSIEALMLLPNTPRQKLDWPPAELASLKNLHTLFVYGWDIGVLSSGKYEITTKEGQSEIHYVEHDMYEKFKELCGPASTDLRIRICIGGYEITGSRHGPISDFNSDEAQWDCTVSGHGKKMSFKVNRETADNQFSFLPDNYTHVCELCFLEYSAFGNTVKEFELFLPTRYLYFIDNNAEKIRSMDGFESLKRLDISKNKIEEGLYHLDDMARSSGCLKRVDLADNPLSGCEYDWLYQVAERGVSLSGLPADLNDNFHKYFPDKVKECTDLSVIMEFLQKHPLPEPLTGVPRGCFCKPYEDITINGNSELEACLREVNNNPNSAVAHYNLGIVYELQGRLDDALLCHKKALGLDPNYARAHCGVGYYFLNRNKLDDALLSYKRGIELEPSYVVAHNNLGVVYERQGRLNDALLCYQKAVELDPSYVRAHCGVGGILLSRCVLDDAVLSFEKAIELDPKYVVAHHNLGVAYETRGYLDAALLSYKKSLELDPDYAFAHCGVGCILLKHDLLDDALLSFKKAVELDPKIADAHCGMGVVHEKQDRLDDALQCYQKAVELDPNKAIAHYNLGHLFEIQGKRDEAIKHYQTAVNLGYKAAETRLSAMNRKQDGFFKKFTKLLFG